MKLGCFVVLAVFHGVMAVFAEGSQDQKMTDFFKAFGCNTFSTDKFTNMTERDLKIATNWFESRLASVDGKELGWIKKLVGLFLSVYVVRFMQEVKKMKV